MTDRHSATRSAFGWTRTCALTALAVPLALLHACANKLPDAPSDLTEGIVIYQDANFRGPASHVTGDIRNLEDITGPCRRSDGDDTRDSWDDCVSSVRVAPGWRATLYEDPDFKGWAADVGEENVDNYQLVRGPCSRSTFNDCASSIRVYRK